MNAKANLPAITGIGSVSPFGPLAGLIPPRSLEPRAIPWATGGLRRAFLVDPFRAADVVPGLKTRRLDRLSAWAPGSRFAGHSGCRNRSQQSGSVQSCRDLRDRLWLCRTHGILLPERGRQRLVRNRSHHLPGNTFQCSSQSRGIVPRFVRAESYGRQRDLRGGMRADTSCFPDPPRASQRSHRPFRRYAYPICIWVVRGGGFAVAVLL